MAGCATRIRHAPLLPSHTSDAYVRSRARELRVTPSTKFSGWRRRHGMINARYVYHCVSARAQKHTVASYPPLQRSPTPAGLDLHSTQLHFEVPASAQTFANATAASTTDGVQRRVTTAPSGKISPITPDWCLLVPGCGKHGGVWGGGGGRLMVTRVTGLWLTQRQFVPNENLLLTHQYHSWCQCVAAQLQPDGRRRYGDARDSGIHMIRIQHKAQIATSVYHAGLDIPPLSSIAAVVYLRVVH